MCLHVCSLVTCRAYSLKHDTVLHSSYVSLMCLKKQHEIILCVSVRRRVCVLLMSQVTVVFAESELVGFCKAGGSCGWWEDPELLSVYDNSFLALCGTLSDLAQSGLYSSSGHLHTCTKKKDTGSWDLFLLATQQSLSETEIMSVPLSEVFKAEAQFVVMTKQLGVIRNVGEKDLRHLKGALLGETNSYILAEEFLPLLKTLTQT